MLVNVSRAAGPKMASIASGCQLKQLIIVSKTSCGPQQRQLQMYLLQQKELLSLLSPLIRGKLIFTPLATIPTRKEKPNTNKTRKVI